MSYELFEKAAALNAQFEKIPSKVSILARGILIDKDGNINYKGKTYFADIVELLDLPTELQNLFIEKNLPERNTQENIKVEDKKNDNLDNLNKILFEQLQNIVDPEKDTDINQELKKANTVCNIADKIINIADLTLKAQIFHDKKRFGSGKSLYQD